jgi:polyisoprenoid-binding protein YceI
MKKALFSLALLAVAASANAQSKSYTLDKAHSSVRFEVDHLMISETEGKFEDFNSTFTAANSDFTGATSLTTTIKASTINTNDPNRDGHLKSADFFETDKYPEIVFKSTSFKKTGATTYDVAGTLTMHGVTKPITLKATYKGQAKDPYGKTHISWVASGAIDRTAYGLTWNKAIEGGNLVGEEVRITIRAEYIAQ